MYSAPFGLGRVPPPEAADVVTLFSQGGAASQDDWIRSLLILCCNPLKVLQARQQTLPMLKAMVSELGVQWCEAYAAWPSLFNKFDSLPKPHLDDETAQRWVAAIWTRSLPWSKPAVVHWPDACSTSPEARVTRKEFEDVLTRVAVHACLCGARGQPEADLGDPVLTRRAVVLAVVLGSVDPVGKRILLCNISIVSKLCWERFHGGNYFDLLRFTLVDQNRPEKGAQKQHEAPRKLMIRASQWMYYSNKEIDREISLQDDDVAALTYLKDAVSKYVGMGKPTKRKK